MSTKNNHGRQGQVSTSNISQYDGFFSQRLLNSGNCKKQVSADSGNFDFPIFRDNHSLDIANFMLMFLRQKISLNKSYHINNLKINEVT